MGGGKNTEMPNLFIIGAQKCGTTSLHHYLDLHPEISMSKIKEPGYFAGLSGRHATQQVTDRETYLSLFARGAPIRGEASPIYSAYPEFPGVPVRIASQAPEARFIYLVRDPLERLRSQIRLRASLGLMEPLNPQVPIREVPVGDMVSRGCYMTQLDQYLEYFPSESILVVDSQELAKERQGTLVSIFTFLGVESDFRTSGFEVQLNTGASLAAPPALYRHLRDSPIRQVATILPKRTRNHLRAVISTRLGMPVPLPEIDHEYRLELESIFRPEVERLREFTGQDFSGWSV